MMSIQNVVACVIERENRFLVCQRPPHKRHGSLWEFPGGKLEEQESFLDATKRELLEELGLHVRSIGDIIISIVDEKSGFTINFVAVDTEGEPKLLEHTAFAWLPLHELSTVPLAPSDRAFVDHYTGVATIESMSMSTDSESAI